MSRITHLLLLSLSTAMLLAATAPTAGAACAGADLPWAAADRAQIEQAVICLVNVERTARGLDALTRDGHLDSAALGHSDDMAANDYFSHTGLDGSSPSARITAAGYAWSATGENIAAGYRSARAAMTGWMASKGHCENILRPIFTDIGVGVASGKGSYGVYWTQNFGRPRTLAGGSMTPAAGCPFNALASDDAAGNAPAGADGQPCAQSDCSSVRITKLRRKKGGRLRVTGRTTGTPACKKLHFTVKRGKRTTRTTRKLCRSSFAVTLRLPRGRGDARVTVKLLNAGPSATRKLKL